MPLYCPHSRSNVVTKAAWQSRHASNSFVANFWVIGKSVIYSRPTGRADVDGVHNSQRINEDVVEHVSQRSSAYVQIEDYIDLQGSSSAARRLFVSSMSRRNSLSALIFCNLSPALAIAVNIGKRLNTSGKTIHVVRTYADAMKSANEIIEQADSPADEPAIDLSECYPESGRTLRPVDLIVDDNLSLQSNDFSDRSIVVDKCIAHSTPTGFLRSTHIPLINDLRKRVEMTLPANSSIDYFIVDSSNLIGTTRVARKEYMKCILGWHQKKPIRMYVGYGTNTFVRTAILLARPLMPFKVRVARNKEHAFQLVNDDRSKRATNAPDSRDGESDEPYIVRRDDLDQILGLIGSINWESQGIDSQFDLANDHPFYYLAQSIKLIKEELDELFVERAQIESQLQQARKMEAVGTITAGIAHDFNNILSMITGNVELALLELPPESSTRTYLEAIGSANWRAKGVIKQLLDYSRKSDQTLQPIDAVAVIKDTVKLLRASIPTTIEIREQFPDTPITIASDATLMSQVLMNLCANSAQAMENTGGILEIHVAVELAVGGSVYGDMLSTAAERLRVTIRDNGPGIESEHIDRIFDPYFTTKEVGKGSGMGLAVVLSIVQSHGGTISVSSRPNKGASFTLTFPVVDDKPSGLPEPVREIPTGNETILFIDDEVAIVKVMRTSLERLGYRVETGSDPRQALSRFRAAPNSFDLVISDMTMPHMTGIEVSKCLRKCRPSIPIIICTGYSSLIDEDRAHKLGIDALVAKPIGIRDMAIVIRSVLDKHSSESSPPDLTSYTPGAHAGIANTGDTGADFS